MKKIDNSKRLKQNLDFLEELNSEIEVFEYIINSKKMESSELKQDTLKFLEKIEKRLTNVSEKIKIIQKSKQ